MQQRRRTPPRPPQRRPEEPLPEEIQKLLKQRSVEAASRLQEIAQGKDPALARAARRALLALKQGGIEPPVRQTTPALGAPRLSGSVRARMSSVGEAGSRMLIFVREDLYGGSPTSVHFLINEERGVLDVFGAKMPLRELEEKISKLRDAEDSLLVEVPVDYARQLLQEAAKRNAETRTLLPEGYGRWVSLVGPAERVYDRPLVYDYLDADQVRTDPSIPHDPDRLFELPVLRAWFLDAEETLPWVEKFIDSQQTRLILDKLMLARRGDKVIEEATDALLATPRLGLYKRRLEESALIFHLAGQSDAAKQALYHAVTLNNGQQPHQCPFAVALTRRTIGALIAVMAKEMEQEQRAQEEGSRVERI